MGRNSRRSDTTHFGQDDVVDVEVVIRGIIRRQVEHHSRICCHTGEPGCSELRGEVLP